MAVTSKALQSGVTLNRKPNQVDRIGVFGTVDGMKSKFLRLFLFAVFYFTSSILSTSAALAHVDVVKSLPADESLVDITPTTITLDFSEKIDAGDVQIELYDSNTDSIPLTGRPIIKNGNQVIVKPPTLEEGSYAVVWKHKGLDAHIATGQVIFSVGIATEFSTKSLVKENINLLNIFFKIIIYIALIFTTVQIIVGRRRYLSLSLLILATTVKLIFLLLESGSIERYITNFPGNVGWLLTFVSIFLLFRSRNTNEKSIINILGLVLYATGFVLTGHLAGTNLNSATATLFGLVHFIAMLFWIAVLISLIYTLRNDVVMQRVKSLTRFIPISIGISVISGIILYLIRTNDENSEDLLQTFTTNYGYAFLFKISLFLLAITLGAVVKEYLKKGKIPKLIIIETATVALIIAIGGLLSNLNSNASKEFNVESLFIVPERASSCIDENGYFMQNCLIRYVRKEIATKSAGELLAELAELRKNSREFLPMCHGVTHALGRSAYIKYGSIEGGFKNGYDVCDFGYYHGVVEGAGRNLTDNEFIAKMPGFCEGLLREGLQELAEQCIHGLGHAAALRVNNDLIRGLSMCDSMQPVQDRYKELPINLMCGTGVTMEWFTHASEAFKYDREEFVVPTVKDPKESCFLVRDKWKASCVEYAPNNSTGRDLNHRFTIVDYCNKFEGYPKERCFWGLGRVSFDGVNGSGLDEAYQICTRTTDLTSQESCLEGAGTMSVIVQNKYENSELYCQMMKNKNFPSAAKVCSKLFRNANSIINGTGDGKIKLDQESVPIYTKGEYNE